MSLNRIDKILDKIEEETRKEKINSSLTSLRYYNGGIHMQGKEETRTLP